MTPRTPVRQKELRVGPALAEVASVSLLTKK
jgi:hypothetical protein